MALCNQDWDIINNNLFIEGVKLHHILHACNSILKNVTEQIVCYVAWDVYKVCRQHNTFTLSNIPGNITHQLLGTLDRTE